MLFLFPVIGLFCFDNLLFVWGIMELQIICYVCCLSLKSPKTGYMLSFLIIQLLAGILLFYFCFLTNFKEIQQYMLLTTILLLLFMKIGIYPFASWALKFIRSLRGIDYWLFLTVIKIIPLIICFFVDNNFYMALIILNWLYSSFILSYHSGYKKIIFFSSISNTCIFFSFFIIGYLILAKIFLLFYFFFITLLILFIEKHDCDFIFSGKKTGNSVILFLLVVRLVGIPFLWGFTIKSIFILSFFFSNVLLLFFSLFIVSLIFSFFYMKLVFFFFFCNNGWAGGSSFILYSEKNFLYYFGVITGPLFCLTLFLVGDSFLI